jgi:hypothetical protein
MVESQSINKVLSKVSNHLIFLGLRSFWGHKTLIKLGLFVYLTRSPEKKVICSKMGKEKCQAPFRKEIMLQLDSIGPETGRHQHPLKGLLKQSSGPPPPEFLTSVWGGSRAFAFLTAAAGSESHFESHCSPVCKYF